LRLVHIRKSLPSADLLVVEVVDACRHDNDSVIDAADPGSGAVGAS